MKQCIVGAGILLTLTLSLAAAAPPNILVILCDDLGYGDLACYGHPTIRTPHLDRLAAEGWRFTDCYAAAPVCSSSRAGLLTGRTPSRVGVYDWIPGGNAMHLPAGEITIPRLLKSAGYDTALAGKWHCNGKFNSPDQPQPGEAGFDHWFATQNNASPSHRNPKNFVRNGEDVGPLEGFSCRLVAGEGIDWLRARKETTRPFYLQVCFHEPHEPIDSPDELVGKYQALGAAEKGQALYYANVENMDLAVGDLMKALDELGVAENTLVFFTSDNGPETLNRYSSAWRSHGRPGPLRGMKLWLYDGGIRVPGIARWPTTLAAGKTVGEPICSVDLLPTFCALADVSPPVDRVLDGTSLVPLFEGQAMKRSQPLFWHYYNAIGDPKFALRDGDWMLLAEVDAPPTSPGSGFNASRMPLILDVKPTRFELYRLRNDIAQAAECASEHPERVEEMAARMAQIMKSVQQEAPDWRK